jgi:hypothetical protein
MLGCVLMDGLLCCSGLPRRAVPDNPPLAGMEVGLRGASGPPFAALLERVGVSEEDKPKKAPGHAALDSQRVAPSDSVLPAAVGDDESLATA